MDPERLTIRASDLREHRGQMTATQAVQGAWVKPKRSVHFPKFETHNPTAFEIGLRDRSAAANTGLEELV